MDLIKPIERDVNEARGQKTIVAEAAQERRYEQAAARLPAVEAADRAQRIKESDSKPAPPPEAKPAPVASASHTDLEYKVNKDTGDVTVLVRDRESGKLLRTIPADELAHELARGNLQPNRLRRQAVLV